MDSKFLPKDANVLDWVHGKNEGKTTFELLLDNTDKALNLRLFANSGDYPGGYNHDLYHAAQKLSYECFSVIAGGDQDIITALDDLWLDCMEDIRYIMSYYFHNQAETVRWKIEEDKELAEEIRLWNEMNPEDNTVESSEFDMYGFDSDMIL